MRKFLANENLPLATIFILLEHGFDVSSIRLDAPSITDREVMQIAIDENRTIITFDRDYQSDSVKELIQRKIRNYLICLKIFNLNTGLSYKKFSFFIA